jgi:hypothetical protein
MDIFWEFGYLSLVPATHYGLHFGILNILLDNPCLRWKVGLVCKKFCSTRLKMIIVAFLNVRPMHLALIWWTKIFAVLTETRNISHAVLCFRTLITIYKLPEVLFLLLLLSSPSHYTFNFSVILFTVQLILLLLYNDLLTLNFFAGLMELDTDAIFDLPTQTRTHTHTCVFLGVTRAVLNQCTPERTPTLYAN